MEEPASKEQPISTAVAAPAAKTTLKTLLDAFAAMEEEEPPASEEKQLKHLPAGAVVAVSRPSSVASSARKVKMPTTLLDAYEVDCIRRELEGLILKHNAAAGVGGAKNADPAHAQAPRTTTPAKNAPSGGGVRRLGRHAVVVCGVSVPVSAVAIGVAAKKETAESDDAKTDHHCRHHQHRHQHHRSSSSKMTSAKNANPAQAPPPTPAKKVPSGGGVRLLGRHAVAVCGVSVPVPVPSVGGGRRRRRGCHREVEKV